MTVPFSFEAALDRTVRWLLEPRAVRWSPTHLPERRGVLKALISTSPRLVVAADAVQSVSGRVLAKMTMRVLVRTFPNATAVVHGDAQLQADLDAIAAEAWPNRLLLSSRGAPDLVVGAAIQSGGDALFIGTDRWISLLSRSPRPVRPGGAASALVAGSIGVAEVTKALVRKLLPRHEGRWTADDLTGAGEIRLNTFDPGGHENPELSGTLDIGEVLLVSAGALSNALILVLLSEPAVVGMIHALDGDLLELSNLNRYLLVGWLAAAARIAKAPFLASFSSGRLQITGDAKAYAPGMDARRLVVVGADRLAARHAIQRDGHHTVLNGASEPDLVRVSLHRRFTDTACVGCINPGQDEPVSDPAATISFVSAFAGGLLAAQLQRVAMGRGVPGRVVDVHPLHPGRPHNLRSNVLGRIPGCGHCLAA
jgi:hypothetical protein